MQTLKILIVTLTTGLIGGAFAAGAITAEALNHQTVQTSAHTTSTTEQQDNVDSVDTTEVFTTTDVQPQPATSEPLTPEQDGQHLAIDNQTVSAEPAPAPTVEVPQEQPERQVVVTSPTVVEAPVIGEVGEATGPIFPERCLFVYGDYIKDVGAFGPECENRQHAGESVVNPSDPLLGYAQSIVRNDDGTFAVYINEFLIDSDATDYQELFNLYAEIAKETR